jgi:hypothetical protein
MKPISFIFCIVLSGLLLSCSQKEILIIKGEPVKSSIKAYAPDCYIKNRGQELLLKEGFLYRNNILRRFIVPHYESILVYNIEEYGNIKEAEPYQKLELERINNQEVILFGQKYNILRRNGDSTFLNQNIILIEAPKTLD